MVCTSLFILFQNPKNKIYLNFHDKSISKQKPFSKLSRIALFLNLHEQLLPFNFRHLRLIHAFTIHLHNDMLLLIDNQVGPDEYQLTVEDQVARFKKQLIIKSRVQCLLGLRIPGVFVTCRPGFVPGASI